MEVLVRRFGRLCIVGMLCAGPFVVQAQSVTNQLVSAAGAASNRAPVAIQHDLDNTHRIRPGDKLSFRVEQDREDAKVLAVTDSGEIELPHSFGRFVAASKTCRVLAQEIKVALEKEYYHRATVHLGIDTKNTVRGKVDIAGQVTKPGPITLPTDQELKVSQAVLLAGPTQWAKLADVRIVRQTGKQSQTIVVDVSAILNDGKRELDVALEPDDLVIVRERGIKFGN